MLSAVHIHREVFSAYLWVTLDRTIQLISRNTAHNSRVQHIWTMIVCYTGTTKPSVADCRTFPKDTFFFMTGVSVWLQDSQTSADQRTFDHTWFISTGYAEIHKTPMQQGGCKHQSAQPGPKCRLLKIKTEKVKAWRPSEPGCLQQKCVRGSDWSSHPWWKPDFCLCVLAWDLKHPAVTSRKGFWVKMMHPSEAIETSEELVAFCPKSHSHHFRTCLVYDATLFLST